MPPLLVSSSSRIVLLCNHSLKVWLSVVVLLWVLCPPSLACAHDGNIQWKSRQSAHIRISYPARLEGLATHALAQAERGYAVMAQLFAYRPVRRIEITLDDYYDAANGFASTIPYDHIHLRAWPPLSGEDLADNGDWLKILVFHELAHVFHMSQTSGLPSVINSIFGRTWLPNHWLPRMWKEGLAVYVETRHSERPLAQTKQNAWSSSGRIARPIYLGRLRAALRDGRFPKLSELTGAPLQWPRSRGWYVFGAWLLDHQAQRYGHARLRRFIDRYGDRPIPYGIQLLYREIYGKSAHQMWQEAVEALAQRVSNERKRRYGSSIEPLASPAAVTLTHDGEWRGRVRAIPNAQGWVLARAPNDGLAYLEQIDGAGKVTRLRLCEMDCDQPLFTGNNRHLMWIATRPYKRLYRRRYVMVASAKGGAARRLPETARVRHVSSDPQGKWLVWTALDRRGCTVLRRASIEKLLKGRGSVQNLWRSNRHSVLLGDPTVASDGTIFWTRGQGRLRAVWSGRWANDATILKEPKPLTNHGLIGYADGQRHPLRWVSDLKWADTGGMGTLSGVVEADDFRDVATLQLGQNKAPWVLQTRTQTGVYSAAMASDGQLVSVEFSGNGHNLYRYDDRTMGSQSVRQQAVRQQAVRQHTTDKRGRLSAKIANPLISPQHGYTAARTLWPRTWRPSVEFRSSSPQNIIAGLSLSGHDALRLWSWMGSLNMTVDGDSSVALFKTTCAIFEPTWIATIGWIRGLSPLGSLRLPLEQWVGRFDGAWRYPFARGALHLSAGLRGAWLRLANERAGWLLDTAQSDPFYQGLVRPTLGGSVTASVKILYDRTEMYPNSSVIERRQSLGLELLWAEPTSSPHDRTLQANLTGRWTLKLGAHQSLQLRGRLSWAAHYNQNAPPLTLSGLPIGDLTQLVSGSPVGDFGVVRGLNQPIRSGKLIAGRGLFWGSATWNVPLPAIGSGLELLPVYIGRTWLAFFVDAAAIVAGDETLVRFNPTTGGWAASAGAELRFNAETGYQAYGTLALGGAWVWGGLSGWQIYLRLAP